MEESSGTVVGPGARLRVGALSAEVLDSLATLVDQAPFGLAIFDSDVRYLLVSRGLAQMHGQDPAESVGRRVEDVLPPPYGERVAGRLRQVLDTGQPLSDVESWGTLVDPFAQRCFTSSFHRLESYDGEVMGVVVLVSEVTEPRKAEIAARSAATHLELLQQVTAALSQSRDVADVTRAVMEHAASAVGATAATLLALDPETQSLETLAAVGMEPGAMERLKEPIRLGERFPPADSLRRKKLILWSSPGESGDWDPALAGYVAGHRSWAFVPLLAEGRGIGVASFGWAERRGFTDAEAALLSEVGLQCAVALERARTLESERRVAEVVEFLSHIAKLVIDGAEEGVLALSTEGKVLAFNNRFCELVGVPERAAHVGAEARSLLAPCIDLIENVEEVRDHLRASMRLPLEASSMNVRMKDGRTLACSASPIVDSGRRQLGRVWYVRDDTGRVALEAAQRSAFDALRARQEYQHFLLRASEIVARADHYRGALERLAAVAVPTLGDLCLVDVLKLDGTVERMAARHAHSALQPLADELRTSFAPDPEGMHPVVEVLSSGRARWSPTMSDAFLRRTTRDAHHYSLVKKLGFTSYMVLPLVGGNRILGSITLVSAGSGRRFSQADVKLAEEFASRVTQVVMNAQRNEAVRGAAHTLQSSLLPKEVLRSDDLDVVVNYLPATVDSEVGGDFYDAFSPRAETSFFVIGDVAGHDITAAAVMGRLRSAARALASYSRGAQELVEMLHHAWPNLESDRIATALVVSLESTSGKIEIASAGHPAPLLVTSADARFLEVEPCTPLGAQPGPVVPWHGQLRPGSTLLLYTDGLIEDRETGLDENSEKLRRVAAGWPEPKELSDRVLEAFVTVGVRHDDVAIMAVARREVDGRSRHRRD